MNNYAVANPHQIERRPFPNANFTALEVVRKISYFPFRRCGWITNFGGCEFSIWAVRRSTVIRGLASSGLFWSYTSAYKTVLAPLVACPVHRNFVAGS